MSERPDDEVRDLLDSASRYAEGVGLEPLSESDAEWHWAMGRRRRSRRRAGAGALAGVAAACAVAIAWQSGLMGGASVPEPTVAMVPDGYTTFVFATPDAPEVDVDTISALRIPDASDLEGTSWELVDQLWGGDRDGTSETTPSAVQIVGGDPDMTTLSFSGDEGIGWGFVADDCGAGWFQEDLALSPQGQFPPGDLATNDQGCPAPAQAAEDFWIEVLAGGGYLRLLGGQWLLVSVVTPTAEGAPTATGPVTGEDPTTDDRAQETSERPATTDEPEGSAIDPEPTTPVEPTGSQTDSAQHPDGTDDTEGTGSTDDTGNDDTGGSQAGDGTGSDDGTSLEPGSPLPGFTAPDQITVSDGWPSSGGDLLAPTVRAGLNEGFDRVVLDLTGTDAPAWRVEYTDNPLRDGSGLPMQIAGDSVLELVITGMAYPEPGDPVYDEGDYGLDTHQLGGVYEVIRTTPFEGQLQLFVGVNGEPRAYRVFLLAEPMRLVIDIQHPD